jgi:hypothetical protein
MSGDRRDYQSVRRKADRARERLAATLEQSRVATARDERTDQRRAARDSVETRVGGDPDVTRSGDRARELGKDGQVGAAGGSRSTDAERE